MFIRSFSVSENMYSNNNIKISKVLEDIYSSVRNDILFKIGDQFLVRSGGFLAGTALLTGVITNLQGSYSGLETIQLAASISAAVSFLGPQLGFVATKVSGMGLKLLGDSISNLIMEKQIQNTDKTLKFSTLERLSQNIDYIVAEQDLENHDYWVIKTDKGKLLKVMRDEIYKDTFRPMIDQSGMRLIETAFENDSIFIRELKNGVLDCKTGPAEVCFYNNNGSYEVLYQRFFINGNLFEDQDDFDRYIKNKNVPSFK